MVTIVRDYSITYPASRNGSTFYFLPKSALSIMLPSLRSTPARDVGIPVLRAMLCFASVMPKALFHEKESPGMPVFDLRRAIVG